MMENLPTIIVIGIVAIIWFYIVARVVTRAIIRTLDERKKRNG